MTSRGCTKLGVWDSVFLVWRSDGSILMVVDVLSGCRVEVGEW